MLCRLTIANIAVIAHADVSFDHGFTVLTGETGAGKSLIFDALTLVLGGRSDRDLIRVGAKSASAAAVFFCDHPLADADHMLVLSRELYRDGRNLCTVNQKPVTVSALREIGETLIDIHGQHENQQIMQRRSHLHYLDRFGNTQTELAAYKTLYDRKNALSAELDALSAAEGEKARKMDMLSFWLDEIDGAAPEVGEDERLASERAVLKNAEKIAMAVNRAHGAIGDDGGARDLLATASGALDDVGTFDPQLAALAENARDALYRTEELAAALSAYTAEARDDARLTEIDERLDLLYKLKTKYGQTIEEVLAYAENARTELAAIRTSGERIAQLKTAIAETDAALQKAAVLLTAKRRSAAAEIEKGVTAELAALDMERVRFQIDFAPRDCGEWGADEVEFFIATNPAEPLKPLIKIASGGEMSRICLALKTVLARADIVPTLIFDEIDAGISGRAALKTGVKLHALGAEKQVICVTHLPQIAARGDMHYRIVKDTNGEHYETTVLPLDRAGRIEELARIISGGAVTDITRKTAEEMMA